MIRSDRAAADVLPVRTDASARATAVRRCCDARHHARLRGRGRARLLWSRRGDVQNHGEALDRPCRQLRGLVRRGRRVRDGGDPVRVESRPPWPRGSASHHSPPPRIARARRQLPEGAASRARRSVGRPRGRSRAAGEARGALPSRRPRRRNDSVLRELVRRAGRSHSADEVPAPPGARDHRRADRRMRLAVPAFDRGRGQRLRRRAGGGGVPTPLGRRRAVR